MSLAWTKKLQCFNGFSPTFGFRVFASNPGLKIKSNSLHSHALYNKSLTSHSSILFVKIHIFKVN